MALKRSMLTGMGLTEEQIAAIIDGHDETVRGLKEQIEALQDRADKADALKKERDDLKKQIDDAKNGTDWKAEFDKLKADTEAKETTAKIKKAFKKMLNEENIDEDVQDAIMEATLFDGMKLEKDDSLKDPEKIRESIKSRWGKFAVTEGIKPTPTKTPPEGNKAAKTRAEIYAKDDHGRYLLSAEERQQALMDNPDLMRGSA